MAPHVVSHPRYRKGAAERLYLPILMCLADHDQQASTRYAARIASLISVQIHNDPIGQDRGCFSEASADERGHEPRTPSVHGRHPTEPSREQRSYDPL